MKTKTSKARRAGNLKEGEEILEALVAMDYEVKQFSPYHFRINGRLDVWPSAKKWYDLKTQEKGVYASLMKFVKDQLK